MNFTQLRTRAAYLAVLALGDRPDKTVPAPDLGLLVNLAYTDFSWETEWNETEIVVTTVANQAEYSLPTPYFKAVKEVIYTYGSGINESQSVRLTQSSEKDEQLMDPLWRLRPATQSPNRWLTRGNNVVRIIDAPISSGDNLTVCGTQLPAALSADADTPGLPDPYHEAIALRAAVKYCEALDNTELDVARLGSYESGYTRLVADCKRYLSGQRYGPDLRRQVRRGYRGRVANYGFGNY